MSGRIRTIKPELLEDAVTAGISDAAFRLYVGALLIADDYGNFRADPRKLRGDIFWAHDIVSVEAVEFLLMENWLAGRSDSTPGLFYLYTVRGQRYGHIRNWEKHQKVDHPGKERVHKPDHEEAKEFRPTPYFSRDSRHNLAQDLRPPTSDPDHDHRPPLLSASPTPVGLLDLHHETEPSTPPAPIPTAGQLALTSRETVPAAAAEDAVRKVYEHYVACWKKAIRGVRAPKLDAKRRKLMQARLREGFTVDELNQASIGIFASKFHMGENDRGKRYTDMDVVFRDAKQVERFMAEVEPSEEAEVSAKHGPAVEAPPEILQRIVRLFEPTDPLLRAVAEDDAALGSGVRLPTGRPAASGDDS